VQSLLLQPLRTATSLSDPAALGWLALYLAGSVLVAFGIYYAYVRFVERRRADELSISGAVRELGAGGMIGGALFATTLLLHWLLGYVPAPDAPGWTVAIVALVFDVAGAVVEELLLRGILFRIAEESVGTWIALAVSVLIFGGLYAIEADAPIAVVVVVGLAGGLLPSAAYARTRRLWLPIGIHAGLDLVQDITFGMTKAGHQVTGALLAPLVGSPLLTGGSLGPQGSIVALVVALAVSTYLLARTVQHGLIVRPFWRRRPQAPPAIA
jgi:uncharacterized protein